MENNHIFIIEDDDTGYCYVFKHKLNAIKFMLDKCKEWGSILYITAKVNGYYQYTDISKVYDTYEKQLEYIINCNSAEINDIFECYWYYQECIIEDTNE